jgi:signal peptidase I
MISKHWIFVMGFIFVRGVFANYYYIPSESMLPNLEIGDMALVNKQAYAHSTPERGDIVVFEYPVEPSTLFTKRVIAVPGDRVVLHRDGIQINGIDSRVSILENNQGFSKYLECWKNSCRTIQHKGNYSYVPQSFVVPSGNIL